MAKQNEGRPKLASKLASVPPERPSTRVRSAISEARKAAAHADLSPTDVEAFERSREKRMAASLARLASRFARQVAAGDPDEAATDRDRIAEIRDEGGRSRDAYASDLELPSTEREAQLHRELEELRSQAAADRERAAEDRAQDGERSRRPRDEFVCGLGGAASRQAVANAAAGALSGLGARPRPAHRSNRGWRRWG